ncbi:MAG TPA: orotidine-5'-phosphate decarboxylase [Candidatus Nitrosocosmicus sp.]|nr:orotidine-5'-phosphate decarboxylase [Candidatus Nitrosocosmicus sp.]
MKFLEKLNTIIEKNNSLLSIGLDPNMEKIPEFLRSREYSFFEFNKAIVTLTSDLVCAFKPNSAFYEALGVEGINQLKMTCDYIREQYPDVVIILDAKRADIGSTNEGYAQFVFEYLRADAITVNPYLGEEALEPFLQYEDKGIIVLCHTSNPGADEFQNLIVDGEELYKHVARNVSKKWNKNNNCLLVVGATYPDEIRAVRDIVGDMTILVPGIGAQGGDLEKTLQAGLNKDNNGLIIHSGREIIYASNQEAFADIAREKALELRDTINRIRSNI